MEQVERWIADDPDPEAQAELRALLERGADDELAARFAGGLTFGTAGLRGALGAGPARMNVATVRRATAGLARYLLDAVDGAAAAGIVIGHDARHGSARVRRGGGGGVLGRGTAHAAAAAGVARRRCWPSRCASCAAPRA